MKVSKLIFCGACAFAMVACSIDEVTQVRDTGDDGTISFKAVLPYSTRAVATTTNNLTEFSVWAWNGDNEYMDDVIAKKNGSVFTTSPLYFWPNGTVDFYALVPATEITGFETGANGVQTEYAYLGGEFDTEFTDEDGTVWAYKGNVAKAKIVKDAISIEAVIPGSYDEQIDLCYAVAKDLSGGSVPMNFRHALSQIVFKARNTNDEMTIRIGGVSVCSVYKQGTYYVPSVTTGTNLPTDDLGTGDIASTQGYWDANEYHKARFAAGVNKTILDGEVNESVSVMADGGALILLPQTVEAWDVLADSHDEGLGAYIRIACNISENGSQLWPNALEETKSTNLYIDPDDGLEYAEIAIPVDIEWEQGYRYTYNLIFGEGAGYYPPDDPNYDLDGTPILYPITFDVTVDEFQETDGVDVPTEVDDDIIPYLLDDNFKAYALENYDLNGNGKVSTNEAALVKRIICHTVADFTGIEYFPNLERFTSYSAETLDLSSNTELIYISLSNASERGDAAPIKTLDLSNNTNLESLTVYGFCGCENLETVILPESLTEIESYAFYKCTALKDVKLSDEMTVLNFNVFYGCTSLESITLPATLTEIGGFAFSYCSKLSSVGVPEGLTTIGGNAFDRCTSLTEFDFNEGLETLGEYAFYNTGLVSVVLPSSLTSIGGSCFLSCTSLETIDFSKTGLTSLPLYTCMGCTSLTSVSFPEKLTELSYNVFYQCTSLASIELPTALKTMGDRAFYDCTVLANVTIPENVESIGDGAFQGCNNMGNVYALPTTPPKIGDKAFYGSNINGRRCYLYVPAESVDAYTEAWGENFASVSAIEN